VRIAPGSVLVALALLAGAGCTWGDAPAPTVATVSPGSLVEGTFAVLSIGGAGFSPEVTADFDHPSRSPVCDRFQVALVAASGSVFALEEVTRLSSTELRGRLPDGVGRDVYAVRVVDPRGETAVLPGGLTIGKCLPPGSACDDGDPCTTGNTCNGADHCGGGTPVADGTACTYGCPAGPAPGTCSAGRCRALPGACPSPSACGGP
jgi:hypothetical protein